MRATLSTRVAVVLLVASVGGWLACAQVVAPGSTRFDPLIADGTRGLTAAAIAVAVGVWWCSRGRHDGRAARAPRRRLGPVAAIGIVVVVANATAAYTGPSTPGTFTMFSNLRTDDEGWNHLVIPRSARVFGFADDATSRSLDAESTQCG